MRKDDIFGTLDGEVGDGVGVEEGVGVEIGEGDVVCESEGIIEVSRGGCFCDGPKQEEDEESLIKTSEKGAVNPKETAAPHSFEEGVGKPKDAVDELLGDSRAAIGASKSESVVHRNDLKLRLSGEMLLLTPAEADFVGVVEDEGEALPE